MKKLEKKNIIVELTLQFSLLIVEYCECIEQKRKYVIANQLLKSGTSIGANIREAQNAESKQDFIPKFKLSAKEVEETEYWLTLCELSKDYPTTHRLKEHLIDIKLIINKIIGTSKRK